MVEVSINNVRNIAGPRVCHQRWKSVSNYFLAPLATLATLALAFNATIYTATSATSVLISDSWYFVETFLMSYYRHGLTLASLLTKRSTIDHAAPVQKLILLADARWFGLDFRMEGLFSIFVALVTLAVFMSWMKRVRQDSETDAWLWIAMAALAAVYLSMNAPVVFEWPLVSLYFVTLLIVFGFFAGVFHTLTSGRYWLAALAGFVCLLCADDIGFLALVAALATICLTWFRGGILRARALGTLFTLGIAVGASRALYILYGGAVAEASAVSPLSRLSAVMALGVKGLAGAVVTIASAPVVHRAQLAAGHGPGIQIGIALLVLALHGWFWASHWKSQPTFLGMVAAAIMIFSYLLAGGIMYGRVSELGLDYLNAPRYVQFYGLGLMAIILQLYVVMVQESSVSGSRLLHRALLLGLSIGLVGLQAIYIKAAWQRAPFAAEYERNLALQIGEAADPRNSQPLQCLPQIIVCRRPYALRKEVMDFLQVHQLNVFSPRIQRLRRLHPAETP